MKTSKYNFVFFLIKVYAPVPIQILQNLVPFLLLRSLFIIIFFPLNTYLAICLNICVTYYRHKFQNKLQVVTDDRLTLFAEMESKYEQKDTEYFVKLLDHPDYVVRTRATCILVDFGGEDKVRYIAKVLKDDDNELVRHEAAFSLGQMYSSSILH